MTPKSNSTFAAHVTKLRAVISSFPVMVKEIIDNPAANQVLIWATASPVWVPEIIGVGEERKEGKGGDGHNEEIDWPHTGEYMFLLSFEEGVTGDDDGEGEKFKRIERIVEFLDGKGTERLRNLMHIAEKILKHVPTDDVARRKQERAQPPLGSQLSHQFLLDPSFNLHSIFILHTVIMQKRKSHTKSRKGCQNCKKRRIKCDEQGPRCANCIIRDTACIYQVQNSAEGSLQDRSANLFFNNSQEIQLRPKALSVASPIISARPSPPSPILFSGISSSRRLLELELMHRWSTRSWMGFYCIPGDEEYLQNHLPSAALRSNYLMSGILATAAVDLARTSQRGDSAKYLCAALEYSNKASADFRAQLCDINPENLHLLYYFAIIAAAINFALTVEQLHILDRMNIFFDMIIGATEISSVNIQWLVESPCSMRMLLNYEWVAINILDNDTKTALDRLTSISHQIRVPVSGDNAQYDAKKHLLGSEVYMYQIAIAQLKHCFAEDVRDLVKGYFTTFAVVPGRELAMAIKNLEPLALVIMMHFGVLLDRIAVDVTAWYLASAGKDLVKEISEILQYSLIAQIPEGLKCIAWTRHQVGLPPLLLRTEN
ncbi:hypothetical protein B7494_g5255 [Chlorociboria aeruginascens]|nr:hypothetical protein B7494_g5255 [Chlorociboria aeruginascens]